MSGGLKTNRGILLRFTKNRGGFTIVEVLIVLAVTGLIFVAAVLLVAGRQGTTQFALAVNDIETQIQQTAGDVANGYYPSNNNFNCTAGVSGNPPVISNGSNAQGTNYGCVFWGKLMQFAVNGATSPTVDIYTIVGNQFDANSQPIQNFAAASPGVLTGSLIAQYTLEYGLTVCSMTYSSQATCTAGLPGGSNQIGALAFITSPNGQSAVGEGSSAQVSVVAITSTSASLGSGPVSNNTPGFNLGGTGVSVIDPPSNQGVQICLVSGSTNQSAVLQVGGNSRNALVTMTIYNSKNC